MLIKQHLLSLYKIYLFIYYLLALTQARQDEWFLLGISISYEGSFNSTRMGRRQRLIIGWIITSALNFLGINVSVYDFVVLYSSRHNPMLRECIINCQASTSILNRVAVYALSRAECMTFHVLNSSDNEVLHIFEYLRGHLLDDMRWLTV